MTILVLLLEFLKIGAFAFGGAYGAIPLIREAGLCEIFSVNPGSSTIKPS